MKYKPLLLVLFLFSCQMKQDHTNPISFSQPEEVIITGYDDHAMEPFLSPDNQILYYNNLNRAGTDTKLHFATRIDDTTFEYQGILPGVNAGSLNAVPSVDSSGIFYFVSTRSYEENGLTYYSGTCRDGEITEIEPVPGISPLEAGWLIFDGEISMDGQILLIVEGRYDASGGPYEANIIIAEANGAEFRKMSDQSVLDTINTTDLEYAPCLSADKLTLYFTRSEISIANQPESRIYCAERDSVEVPFDTPYPINEITGFSEAPALSPDGQLLYYHSETSKGFKIFLVRKNQ